MKILWLTNVSLPEASILMDEKPSYLGGWLINASKDLSNQEDIELSVAFPQGGIKAYKKLKGQKIDYYVFGEIIEKDRALIEHSAVLKNIIKEANPDIVHIYGTEIAHTLAMINLCRRENIKAVVSIQGLVSIIEKHVLANLPWRVVYGATIRNILRKDSVYGLKKLLLKRGENEIESIKKADHIIGRTTWDRACTCQINPVAKYHLCNETLREEFYKYAWDFESCEPHSIFLSQGQYSVKGLHYVIKAMPLILERFPDAKVYVGGKNIVKSDTLKDRLLITRYGKYIKKTIKSLGLENNVVFTGPLDEKKMCERYLKSHVFICPSSIENSSNSLGEAMILGVPSVASNVGGLPDMLEHKCEGFLYQHDAPYMLAYYVCRLFEDKNLALDLSKRARARALNTHGREENTRKLIGIYGEIISSS